MQAIVLAGGFGTRLRPLTYTRPKPLLPVAGRPLIDWVLDRVPAAVDEVIVAAQWQADQIEQHLDANPRDFSVRVVREDEPLGSGGAIRHAVGDATGSVLVLNADIVTDMDLAAFVEQHQRRDAELTIALFPVATELLKNFGIAKTGADGKRIEGFVEKPSRPEDAPSRLANAGIYLLEPSVIRRIPTKGLVSLEKDIFPQVLGGRFDGWRHDGYWIDVGDRERMIKAHQVLSRDKGANVIVGPGSRIEAGARVTRSVLGAGVVVRRGATIDRCLVGDEETVTGEHSDEGIWSRPVPSGYPAKQVGNAMAATP